MLGLDIAAFSIMVIHDGIQIFKDSHDYRQSIKQEQTQEQPLPDTELKGYEGILPPVPGQTVPLQPVNQVQYEDDQPHEINLFE